MSWWVNINEIVQNIDNEIIISLWNAPQYTNQAGGDNFTVIFVIIGVSLIDGQLWKTHRKLLMTFMRDKQVGKLGFECVVTEEIKHYLQVRVFIPVNLR